MNLHNLCQTVHYKGEFAGAIILLGPSLSVHVRISKVSAFQVVCLYVSLWIWHSGPSKCPHYCRWPGVCKAGFHCSTCMLVNIHVHKINMHDCVNREAHESYKNNTSSDWGSLFHNLEYIMHRFIHNNACISVVTIRPVRMHASGVPLYSYCNPQCHAMLPTA